MHGSVRTHTFSMAVVQDMSTVQGRSTACDARVEMLTLPPMVMHRVAVSCGRGEAAVLFVQLGLQYNCLSEALSCVSSCFRLFGVLIVLHGQAGSDSCVVRLMELDWLSLDGSFGCTFVVVQ